MDATRTITPADVIISIYKRDGSRVTTAVGPARSLSLWRNRWVRGGYIARQIDGKGQVREYSWEH
jgi:hypothetical protein